MIICEFLDDFSDITFGENGKILDLGVVKD